MATDKSNELDLAKYSMPVLSSSAPELEGAWQEVKRRQREKDKTKQKTFPQVDHTVHRRKRISNV